MKQETKPYWYAGAVIDGKPIIIDADEYNNLAEELQSRYQPLYTEDQVNFITSNFLVSRSGGGGIVKAFKELREMGMGKYWDEVKCICSELGRSRCNFNCKEYEE